MDGVVFCIVPPHNRMCYRYCHFNIITAWKNIDPSIILTILLNLFDDKQISIFN